MINHRKLREHFKRHGYDYDNVRDLDHNVEMLITKCAARDAVPGDGERCILALAVNQYYKAAFVSHSRIYFADVSGQVWRGEPKGKGKDITKQFDQEEGVLIFGEVPFQVGPPSQSNKLETLRSPEHREKRRESSRHRYHIVSQHIRSGGQREDVVQKRTYSKGYSARWGE